MNRRTSYCVISAVAMIFVLMPFAFNVFAEEPVFKMVANGELAATLQVNGEKVSVAGRTSIYFEAGQEAFEAGQLTARAVNILFLQVPQAILTYDKIDSERKGALGIALLGQKGPQYVTYDPKALSLKAQLVGYADADYMADMADLPYKDEDYVETPKQPVEISFVMKLQEPLVFKDTGEEIIQQKGEVAFDIHAKEDFLTNAAGFTVTQPLTRMGIDTSILWRIEAAKRLKIQPVRIGRIKPIKPYGTFVTQYSGAGLNFGLPQLKEQWAKADVVFSINEWVTVWDSSFWIFDETEATDLKSRVNVDDALEVFFVYDFSPESTWGGGATWGLGSASSKIITSDGNARGGIDFTHLAHEVGHGIGLPHPYGSPGVSTNTLMCPSGWLNDNPQTNSQENKDNISSPLFTFSLKLRSAGPDCLDSADCGWCP